MFETEDLDRQRWRAKDAEGGVLGLRYGGRPPRGGCRRGRLLGGDARRGGGEGERADQCEDRHGGLSTPAGCRRTGEIRRACPEHRRVWLRCRVTAR